MEKIYILIDVGGTQIKGSVADQTGKILGEPICALAHSGESGQIVFDHFAVFMQGLLAGVKGKEAAGVAMAFPGPFDYEKGISLMRGLNKYEGIFGLSIEEELKRRVPEIRNAKFCFLHDVEAFALGESWFGEVRNVDKILCLCIGTGTGSAFVESREVLKKKGRGVPADGWIFDTPFRESIIDDYLSVRGLAALSGKILGTESSGNELYEQCRENHSGALLVYREFGEILRDALTPFLNEFKPQAVVMGGQISKSFCYFGQAFRMECGKRNIRVCTEPETSLRAMQGLLLEMRRRGKRELP